MTTNELIEKGIGHNCLSDAYDLGKADEQDRMLSIVSRCIAHNVYNVSEGIALLNEIKEELKEQK